MELSTEHQPNWLDQCRLGLAALVIFSHSFALTSTPEPLERIIGTTDLGKVAVGGFLVLSGYLISQAWARNPQPLAYLRNRTLRIVPAYVVAFALSVAAALAVGGTANWHALPRDLLTLNQPTAAFPLGPHTLANGALWTIQLEFFCYLMAPLALFRRSTLITFWALAAIVTMVAPSFWARGVLLFLSGASYWRFGLRARRGPVIASAIALPVLMFAPLVWQLGLATFGAYLLLSLGLRPHGRRGWVDISYGVYLYGWPVQKLLIMGGLMNPWLLAPAALTISAVLGAASWFGIERYALRMKSGRQTTILAPQTPYLV